MKRIPLFLLSVAATFASCKKDKGFRYTGCRVKEVKETVTDTNSSTVSVYQLIYNEEGRVQQITRNFSSGGATGSLIKVFAYTANSIRILNISQQQSTSRDSLVLDAHGRVIKIFEGMSRGSLPHSWREYIYDGEGQLLTMFSQPAGSNSRMDSMFWDNGNMVRHTLGYDGTLSNDLRYSYYDTVYNIGIVNVPLLELLTYGHGITRVNKLDKSMIDVPGKKIGYDRSYKLDADGKILEITHVIPMLSRTSISQISYDCR